MIQSSPAVLTSSVDAGLRDHAAIADQHDMVEGEAVLQLGDLIGQGQRIAGVSFEHLDGDRAAVGRAEQAIDDLQLALLAVAAVAALGQRAAAAFHVARGDVVEHQRPAFRWRLASAASIAGWRSQQPVEGRVKLVLVDLAKTQCVAEAGGGGVGGRALWRWRVSSRDR